MHIPMIELILLQSYGAPLTSTSASSQPASLPSECYSVALGGLTTTRLMKPRPQDHLVPWNIANWKRSRSQLTLVSTVLDPPTAQTECLKMVIRHRNESPSPSDLGRMMMVMTPTSSLTTSMLKLLPRTRHNRTGPLPSF